VGVGQRRAVVKIGGPGDGWARLNTFRAVLKNGKNMCETPNGSTGWIQDKSEKKARPGGRPYNSRQKSTDSDLGTPVEKTDSSAGKLGFRMRVFASVSAGDLEQSRIAMVSKARN